LIKEPKLYLWDWSLVDEEGHRNENLVASHLLKATHFWSDRGMGEYGLYYLRTKDKIETDFLVTKNGKPWFLVEVKTKARGISPALYHFQKETGAPGYFATESCTTGDHMTHDDVRFEIEQVVGLSFASRVGEDAGRLLEGSC
jgi:predicted AAA+ superfamily ATPase